MSENAVVTRPKADPGEAIAKLDPQALLRTALENGAGIETLERLVALEGTVRARQAKEAWYSAMAEFQRLCPSVEKTKVAKIRTRNGGEYSYKFAPLDEIMGKILPVMGPLGLSVGFRVKHEPNQVVATCIVSHELGHAEDSGPVHMPIPPAQDNNAGANPMQRVGIATSYAKRYALLAVTGIAPEDDPDGRTGDSDPEPQRTVTRPQRASASQSPPAGDEPPPPGDEPREPAKAAPGCEWKGTLTALETQTGTKKNGQKWTLWRLKAGDSQICGTFSAELADLARSYINEQTPVRVVFERSESGARNLVAIEPLGEESF